MKEDEEVEDDGDGEGDGEIDVEEDDGSDDEGEDNENSEDGENSEGGDDSEDGKESEVTEIKFASDPKSTVNWEYAHTDERQGITFAYRKRAHREAIWTRFSLDTSLVRGLLCRLAASISLLALVRGAEASTRESKAA